MNPPGKLFSLLVIVLLGLYGAAGFYFLPLASFEGDLTRISMLPETLFGWRKPQPAIDPALLEQSSWQNADVLVVGDSFSNSHIWQTALTRRGLRVHTESWDSIRAICEDFPPWLRSQGFKGKLVIFEYVENNIPNGVRNSIACKRMSPYSSAHTDTPRLPPVQTFDRNIRRYDGQLSVGLQSELHILKYLRFGAPLIFTGKAFSAKVAHIPDGCLLFSHRQCQDALFLNEDREEDLPDEVITNIRTLNRRLGEYLPVWVFVPNKSTAYLYPNKSFFDKIEYELHAPNLLKMAHQAIGAHVTDLYPANNTHFSTTGYLLMGETIYQSLPETLFAPSTKLSRLPVQCTNATDIACSR